MKTKKKAAEGRAMTSLKNGKNETILTFQCECHSMNHMLRVTFFQGDEDSPYDQVYFEMLKHPSSRTLFQRIGDAAAYVFKKRPVVSDTSEALFSGKGFETFCDEMEKIRGRLRSWEKSVKG